MRQAQVLCGDGLAVAEDAGVARQALGGILDSRRRWLTGRMIFRIEAQDQALADGRPTSKWGVVTRHILAYVGSVGLQTSSPTEAVRCSERERGSLSISPEASMLTSSVNSCIGAVQCVQREETGAHARTFFLIMLLVNMRRRLGSAWPTSCRSLERQLHHHALMAEQHRDSSEAGSKNQYNMCELSCVW